MDPRRGGAGRELAATSFGIVIFALLAHRGLPWVAAGALGLLLSAAAMGASLRRAARPAELLGLDRLPRSAITLGIAGIGIGCGAAMLHRWTLDLPIWPNAGPTGFAAVACLIGATEEVVYRGWVQGAARPYGWPVAVVIAAAAHATYKTALFVLPAAPPAVDLVAMGGWTIAGGLVLGLMRQISGSLVPAILAHAAFDFVVYGTLAHAPWWVW